MEKFLQEIQMYTSKESLVQMAEKLREKERLVQNKKAKECHSPSSHGLEKCSALSPQPVR